MRIRTLIAILAFCLLANIAPGKVYFQHKHLYQYSVTANPANNATGSHVTPNVVFYLKNCTWPTGTDRNYFYARRVDASHVMDIKFFSNGQIRIQDQSGDLIAGAIPTFTSGHTVTLVLNGSTATVYDNGVSVLSYGTLNSNFSTGTVWLYSCTGGCTGGIGSLEVWPVRQ